MDLLVFLDINSNGNLVTSPHHITEINMNRSKMTSSLSHFLLFWCIVHFFLFFLPKFYVYNHGFLAFLSAHTHTHKNTHTQARCFPSNDEDILFMCQLVKRNASEKRVHNPWMWGNLRWTRRHQSSAARKTSQRKSCLLHSLKIIL